MRGPTGDATCLPHVRHAKDIWYNHICPRSNATRSTDIDDLYSLGFEKNDNEEVEEVDPNNNGIYENKERESESTNTQPLLSQIITNQNGGGERTTPRSLVTSSRKRKTSEAVTVEGSIQSVMSLLIARDLQCQQTKDEERLERKGGLFGSAAASSSLASSSTMRRVH
ncbi:hypothetical protein ACA910_006773 [Epithemia clementina (nom. ined.)]